MTSRTGRAILETGSEISPDESLIAPVGNFGAVGAAGGFGAVGVTVVTVVEGTTTAVAAEVTVVDPDAFFASTNIRIRWPTSVTVSFTCVPVAKTTQLLPLASQRFQLYTNDVGAFVHVPGVAVSTSPSRAMPLMTGGALDTGSDPFGGAD